jgi:Xaa-Pro aminopeptidase
MHSFSHYQEWFKAEDFRKRHERIYDIIGKDAVALLQGGGPVAGFETFRQTNDFFYLTGLEVPQAYLLLDGRSRRSNLYLPYRDPKPSIEGVEPAAQDAGILSGLTGCDTVSGPEKMEKDLAGVRTIYTTHDPAESNTSCQDTLRAQAKLVANDKWDSRVQREKLFIDLLGKSLPSAEIKDLSPVIYGMRLIKDKAELNIMRKAGQLCAAATLEAMRCTRPGLYEYQLGAIADCIYRMHGATGGYRPIIAASKNIWLVHYFRNNCVMKEDDHLLFDYAPELCYYTSDIGRIWPVNGKYNPLYRELYGFVVAYHEALLRLLRPHVMPSQVLQEAADEMKPFIARHPFSKPIYEQAAQRLMKGDKVLTHCVGMAVHDPGTYVDRPFQPGLVFALDPQMWVPEEQLYIRVEDTVVITEDGVESFTSDAPRDLDEIESVMRKKGVVESIPLIPIKPD